MKLLSVILFSLFFIGWSGQMRSQNVPFKGVRYTLEIIDSKNPGFSEADMIKDISSLNGVFTCKYIKEKKMLAVYATHFIDRAELHLKLVKQSLGYLNFQEKVLSISNIEEDTYETK